MQVDAVEQRSRDLPRVAQPLSVGAGADAAQVSHEPAGARVHGRDEEEVAGKSERASDAHEMDSLLLERLADCLQDVAPELGELV